MSNVIGIQDQAGISEVITNEFMKRFRSSNSINLKLAIQLSEANNDMLIVEIYLAEILKAVKQINPLKTPGPDGLQATFYHKY